MFGGRPEDTHELDRRVERLMDEAEIAKARRASANRSVLQRLLDSLQRLRHRS